MNNFDPTDTPQRRADMDGGLTFDELCLIGAVLIGCLGLSVFLLMPVMVPWS